MKKTRSKKSLDTVPLTNFKGCSGSSKYFVIFSFLRVHFFCLPESRSEFLSRIGRLNWIRIWNTGSRVQLTNFMAEFWIKFIGSIIYWSFQIFPPGSWISDQWDKKVPEQGSGITILNWMFISDLGSRSGFFPAKILEPVFRFQCLLKPRIWDPE